MKNLTLTSFLIALLVWNSSQIFADTGCTPDSVLNNPFVVKYSNEIALQQMMSENHQYHDSILVPEAFRDSIKKFVATYHNAMLTDSTLIDYRMANVYQSTYASVMLEFKNASDYVILRNDSIIILNDTLSHYLDSLNLVAYATVANLLLIEGPNIYKNAFDPEINMFGDFSFFSKLSGVGQIEKQISSVDSVPCNYLRSGIYSSDTLTIILEDYGPCNEGYYYKNWFYSVSNQCNVILSKNYEYVDAANIEQVNMVENIIYPNPAHNTIYFDNTTLNNTQFYIFNLYGHLQMQGVLNETSIDISQLLQGSYLIQTIDSDNQIKRYKFIKN